MTESSAIQMILQENGITQQEIEGLFQALDQKNQTEAQRVLAYKQLEAALINMESAKIQAEAARVRAQAAQEGNRGGGGGKK